MKNSNLFVFLFLITFSVLDAQEISVHDPVVAEQDGIYYLFHTGRRISVYSSVDLENWEREKPVFSTKPEWTDKVVPDFRNHIWAPDIFHKNNTYYLYYSVSSFGKNTSAIGVATNKTLHPNDNNFQWIDHGIVIQSVPNRDMWNAIDPNIIEDEEGRVWMSFGSFWNGLKLVKMSEDLKSIAQPEAWHTIARRERSFKTPDRAAGDAALEAPFIFRKNQYYYQFLSWDYCCQGENSTYKVAVGRSKDVTGPYLDKEGKALNQGGGTIVVQGNENWYGAGHNSVYTFGSKDYMFFHAYDANDDANPKLKVKELTWAEGWPSLAPLK